MRHLAAERLALQADELAALMGGDELTLERVRPISRMFLLVYLFTSEAAAAAISRKLSIRSFTFLMSPRFRKRLHSENAPVSTLVC